MINNLHISRRELMLAAGSAAWLATGLCPRTGAAATDAPTDLVRRCGAIRFGYSSAVKIAPGTIETEHARQLAFLLSFCGLEGERFTACSAGIAPHAAFSFPATLMTMLSDTDGRRLEIVTTAASLPEPVITLRGDKGSLHVNNDRMWFSGDTGELCAWKNDQNLLPAPCLGAFHAAQKRINEDDRRLCAAQHILKG